MPLKEKEVPQVIEVTEPEAVTQTVIAMRRGRPGRTPKQVKQTKEKPPGHQGLSNHGNLPGPGPGRPKGSRNKFGGQLERYPTGVNRLGIPESVEF
jgi:hypothetical protein